MELVVDVAVAAIVAALRRIEERDFEKLAGRTRALTSANFQEHGVAAVKVTDPSTGSLLCWVEVNCGVPQVTLTRPWCGAAQQIVAETAAKMYNEEVAKKIG